MAFAVERDTLHSSHRLFEEGLAVNRNEKDLPCMIGNFEFPIFLAAVTFVTMVRLNAKPAGVLQAAYQILTCIWENDLDSGLQMTYAVRECSGSVVDFRGEVTAVLF